MSQGVHNLSGDNHHILDPSLTRYGEDQCRHLTLSFPYHDSVELLCSSPLVRTLQTTLLSFGPEIKKGMQIVALPDAQETSNVPCDTGKDPESLREVMRGKPVDLSLVEDGWNNKTGIYSDTPEAIAARARNLRRWLKARPEKEVVLVTHGGFLHWLTEDYTGFVSHLGTGWANTEFRSYQFKDGERDSASMVETVASRELRSGTEHPPSETERLELQRTKSKESSSSKALYPQV